MGNTGAGGGRGPGGSRSCRGRLCCWRAQRDTCSVGAQCCSLISTPSTDTPAVVEFNIQTDPEAARLVFESGVALVMVPLEVTHTALASTSILQVCVWVGCCCFGGWACLGYC